MHTRGRYWPTNWVMTKIFLSIYSRYMINKPWKISSQYLERFQIYCHLTEKFWQLHAYFYTNWPVFYGRRQATAWILNDNKSKTAQDIDLNFSAFIHHIFGLNWQKNLGHFSISGSVVPSSVQKLLTPLATLFVEKNFEKNF